MEVIRKGSRVRAENMEHMFPSCGILESALCSWLEYNSGVLCIVLGRVTVYSEWPQY